VVPITKFARAALLAVGIATILCGCNYSGYGQPPTGVIRNVLVVTPGSSPQTPIVVTLSNPTATLTAAELGYSGGFSATPTQGAQCINVSQVLNSTNKFTVTRTTGPCPNVVVSVTDANEVTASVYIATQ
jgi:hypothetical protein